MDLLQLAQHRFEQLSPLLLQPLEKATSDAVETWLRDQVCAVAAQLCKNRRFQCFARWSGDHLASGAEAPERKLVETVDCALIECARLTADAARQLGIPSSSDGQDSNGGPINPATSLELGFTPSNPPDRELSVIDWIAKRPYCDLVCVKESFDGTRGLHLQTSRVDVATDFWRRCDPRVPLGDYVCRGMLLRIDYFAGRIEETWKTCFEVAPTTGDEGFGLARRLFSAKMRLDQAISLLREACHRGNDARLRDACLSLIQVYAAYAPNPDLDWFGRPKSSVVSHAPLIRSVVRPPASIVEMAMQSDGGFEIGKVATERLCRPDVINGIAAALDVVAPIYRRPIDGDGLIDWLRQSKRLVIVDRRPRTVYWDGDEIKANWDRRSALWDFLWKLSQFAQSRKPMDREVLTGPDASTNKVKHRRSELSKIIPTSLNVLIEDIRPRGYQLELEPDAIVLLALHDDGQLVEAKTTALQLP